MARQLIQQVMKAKNIDWWWSKAPSCKWFDGYCGQRIALFDDYGGGWLPFGTAKLVFDPAGYEVRLEVKGRTTMWTAEWIFITANRHPDEIYDVGPEEVDEWCRRMGSLLGYEGKCIHMTGRGEWEWVSAKRRDRMEVTWPEE